jgi:hypothetical protein
VNEENVGFQLLNALSRLFVGPTQRFPAAFRTRFVLGSVFRIHEVRRMRCNKPGKDLTFGHRCLLLEIVWG